jgi:hypothetical protein
MTHGEDDSSGLTQIAGLPSRAVLAGTPEQRLLVSWLER